MPTRPCKGNAARCAKRNSTVGACCKGCGKTSRGDEEWCDTRKLQVQILAPRLLRWHCADVGVVYRFDSASHVGLHERSLRLRAIRPRHRTTQPSSCLPRRRDLQTPGVRIAGAVCCSAWFGYAYLL